MTEKIQQTASILSLTITNLENEYETLIKLIHRNYNQHRCTKIFSNLHKVWKRNNITADWIWTIIFVCESLGFLFRWLPHHQSGQLPCWFDMMVILLCSPAVSLWPLLLLSIMKELWSTSLPWCLILQGFSLMMWCPSKLRHDKQEKWRSKLHCWAA